MAKFARGVFALLFALTAVAAWAAPVPKRASEPVEMPDAVAKAWVAAGAQPGRAPLGDYGPAPFSVNAAGALPAFAFARAPHSASAFGGGIGGNFGNGGFQAAGGFGGNFGGGAFGFNPPAEVCFSSLPNPGRPFALAFPAAHCPDADAGLHKHPHLHTIAARPTNETGLAWLAPLAQLRGLRLEPALNGPDYDAELKFVARLKRLEALSLDGTPTGDTGVRHVAALPDLQRLDLGGTKVTDAGLKHLAGARALSRLRLAHTRTGDAGLAHLVRHTEATHLDLSHTQITDAGLKHLAAFDALAELNLHGCRVTADGLKQLACLPRLRKLDLGGTGATDRELEVLAACTELRELNLTGTSVTDDGLRPLRARPALTIVGK